MNPDLPTMPVSKYFCVFSSCLFWFNLVVFPIAKHESSVNETVIVGCMYFGNYPCRVIKWDPVETDGLLTLPFRNKQYIDSSISTKTAKYDKNTKVWMKNMKQ